MFSCRILWSHNLYLSLLPILSLFWCMVQVGGLVSFCCMYLPNFPNIIYWRDSFYSIIRSFFLCQILINPIAMDWFLGSLFCLIDLYTCSASTRLFWLKWSSAIVWYQELYSFPLGSTFSRLLRVFGVSLSFIKIFGIFALDLWNMTLVF